MPQPQLSWIDIEKLLDNPKQKVRASLVEDAEIKRQFQKKLEDRFNWVQLMFLRIRALAQYKKMGGDR